MLHRYFAGVWDNLTASWVIPTTCGLALIPAILMSLDVERAVMYMLLRIDGFAVLLYYSFGWRRDLRNQRARRTMNRNTTNGTHAGKVSARDAVGWTPIDPQTSLVLAFMLAFTILVVLAAIGHLV